MQRRNFIQQSLLAGGALFTSAGSAFASQASPGVPAEKPFHLNYGIHDGMFKNLAGSDFIDQIKFAHGQGFRAIEDNGMMARPVEQQQKIGDTLASLGMA